MGVRPARSHAPRRVISMPGSSSSPWISHHARLVRLARFVGRRPNAVAIEPDADEPRPRRADGVGAQAIADVGGGRDGPGAAEAVERVVEDPGVGLRDADLSRRDHVLHAAVEGESHHLGRLELELAVRDDAESHAGQVGVEGVEGGEHVVVQRPRLAVVPEVLGEPLARRRIVELVAEYAAANAAARARRCPSKLSAPPR